MQEGYLPELVGSMTGCVLLPMSLPRGRTVAVE